ncbi:MAG TPA: bifunctional histidinol-phosphatase/imidazoleglycerol-phosphate dehydratase, partial [Cytophagales bacterium]|nr:bifunctional histidinol-phosphatase/imidazoleglycerol-phosphate dehydratase [Cytophagales bacterium]
MHIDRSLPAENKPTRKPGTGTLTGYFSEEYDLGNSYVIGDRVTDIELAKNLGAKGILINNGSLRATLEQKTLLPWCAQITTSWHDIVTELTPKRTAFVHRQHKESDIRIKVNLDGTGQSKLATGMSLFDHKLE